MKKILFFGLILAGYVGIVRADSSTTRLGLTKPSIGSTGWGAKWNTNADTIDNGAALLASSNTYTQPQIYSSTIALNSTTPSTIASTATAQNQIPRFGQVKLLQVVTAVLNTSSSTSSGNFGETGLTASITPSSVSSKIFVAVSGVIRSTDSANSAVYATIYRNISDLGNGTAGFCIANNQTSVIDLTVPCSMMVLDSPGTTSSTTYSVRVRSDTVGRFGTWNPQSGKTTITLFEINGL